MSNMNLHDIYVWVIYRRTSHAIAAYTVCIEIFNSTSCRLYYRRFNEHRDIFS